MRVTRWFLLCAALLLAHSAHAADPARIVAAKRTLVRGAYAKNNDGLLKARFEFDAMSRKEPQSALLHYWAAVADWRVVPKLLSTAKPKAERYCKEGLAHAEQALKIDPQFAEALAIKASLQGLSLQFDPGAMMSLGPEMSVTMNRALELAPANPRVQLLTAMGTLHKPEFVGGGPDKAMPQFKKANELFSAEAVTDSTAPDWGREDALIWSGRCAVRLKDYEAGRDFYKRALELNPSNGWVEYVLKPELEKAAAAPVAKDKS